ncbi:MAG: DNA oxidative demethylase AlkB [Proteobacteria bacterium]|nr:DNA oxidative demethylase AlkB [Pseudomonadota bacterium]
MDSLFSLPDRIDLAAGAVLLPGAGLADEALVVSALETVLAQAPPRHMVTPGGQSMSVAMSNCGRLGWVSDRSGYRYQPTDPDTGLPWPDLPDCLARLAHSAAARAGFEGFAPDACLISVYTPGARLSLHQDKDEQEVAGHPLVSLSLGLSATFQLGGLSRSDKPIKVPVSHGDVLIWGGPSRLRYHGVAALPEGEHALMGRRRVNTSFRKAG